VNEESFCEGDEDGDEDPFFLFFFFFFLLQNFFSFFYFPFIFLENLRACLEPHGFSEFNTVLGENFRECASESTQHSPSAVDYFKLTVLSECLRVSRESRCPSRSLRGILQLSKTVCSPRMVPSTWDGLVHTRCFGE
jgi:hypothetical protein